jgi:hypothetical protein
MQAVAAQRAGVAEGGGVAGGRVHLTLAVLGTHLRNDLGVDGLVRALGEDLQKTRELPPAGAKQSAQLQPESTRSELS